MSCSSSLKRTILPGKKAEIKTAELVGKEMAGEEAERREKGKEERQNIGLVIIGLGSYFVYSHREKN